MEPKKIISLNGSPRSGTSWLGQLFESSPEVRYKFQPLFSNSFKDRIHVRSTTTDINAFFSELYHYEDAFLDRTLQKEKGIHAVFENKVAEPPVLVMKHVRYHYLIEPILRASEQAFAVGIVRNPCAVLNSWRNAPKEFLAGWDFEQEWRFAPSYNRFRPGEYYGLHRWMELAKLFLWLQEQYPERFVLVRYEDLVQQPDEGVAKLFDFCGLELTEQTRDFIAATTNSANSDVYSVFKGGKSLDSWRENFPAHILQQIEAILAGTEFEQFLH